jgi:hypothetical protein
MFEKKFEELQNLNVEVNGVETPFEIVETLQEGTEEASI